MRINKYLAMCGVSSRRKAEEFVLQGMVKVNGTVVTNLAKDIDENKDVVLLNGQKLALPENFVYYLLNKPKGYVCTLSDDRGRKTIVDLIDGIDKRVFPVGRLDYDSEGLLLLTNDGDFAYKLTHPSHQVPKTYIVKVEGKVLESELAVLRAGVVVDGVRYNKCKVRVLNAEEKTTRMEVIITEGKNREIRNMFKAIGKVVILLKRVAEGNIKLGGLSRGEYRQLKQDEVDRIIG